jgi:hypothetical protein
MICNQGGPQSTFSLQLVESAIGGEYCTTIEYYIDFSTNSTYATSFKNNDVCNLVAVTTGELASYDPSATAATQPLPFNHLGENVSDG